MAPETWYFWKVRAVSPALSDWSPTFVFRTMETRTDIETHDNVKTTKSRNVTIPVPVWICIILIVVLIVLLLVYIQRVRQRQ